jgi:5-hydroxyisourate hydrolase
LRGSGLSGSALRLRRLSLQLNLLGALPENSPAELGELLTSLHDGSEMIAGQRAESAREVRSAVGKEDLRLAVTARVEKQLPGAGVSGGILDGEIELKIAHGNPCRFTAPASLDYLGAQRKQTTEDGNRSGSDPRLQPSPETEVSHGDHEHVSKSITFSTHVLDTATGSPAPDVGVELTPSGGAPLWGTTDSDGRLKFEELLEPGDYELSFHLEGHFAGRPHLSDRLRIHLLLEDPRHYHVPLLVSPFGFASYRGS